MWTFFYFKFFLLLLLSPNVVKIDFSLPLAGVPLIPTVMVKLSPVVVVKDCGVWVTFEEIVVVKVVIVEDTVGFDFVGINFEVLVCVTVGRIIEEAVTFVAVVATIALDDVDADIVDDNDNNVVVVEFLGNTCVVSFKKLPILSLLRSSESGPINGCLLGLQSCVIFCFIADDDVLLFDEFFETFLFDFNKLEFDGNTWCDVDDEDDDDWYSTVVPVTTTIGANSKLFFE